MEEDGTEKPEPPGDAPAADRDAAASASGPAELQSSCFRAAPTPAVSSPVRRAPLLLQPAVGHAGALVEQKVSFEVGRACRPLRTGPATADAECALEDGWADTPGASCPVSAVVAPPAPSGTALTSPTAALAVQELQRLYQAQRSKNPGLDEIFVLFISFVLCNSRFAAEFNWDAVFEELQLWKQEDSTGVAALNEMPDMFGRSKREQLAQLLEPWLRRWQVAASQARPWNPAKLSPYESQFG